MQNPFKSWLSLLQIVPHLQINIHRLNTFWLMSAKVGRCGLYLRSCPRKSVDVGYICGHVRKSRQVWVIFAVMSIKQVVVGYICGHVRKSRQVWVIFAVMSTKVCRCWLYLRSCPQKQVCEGDICGHVRKNMFLSAVPKRHSTHYTHKSNYRHKNVVI